jgi:hypothetical protein
VPPEASAAASTPVLGKTELLLGAQATSVRLLATLKEIAAQAGPQDIFVLAASTHGSIEDGQYVLYGSNFKDPNSPEGLVTTPALLAALRAIPAQRQIVFLDTCNAGQLDTVLAGVYDARVTLLARNIGLHVLAATQTDEEANDREEGNGLFTHVLLKGVRSGQADANNDGRVSIRELARHGQTAAAQLSVTGNRVRQTPVTTSVGEDFDFLRSR